MPRDRTIDAFGGRPIERRDIDELAALTGALGSACSEHCAANLFLFREVHRYRRVEAGVIAMTGLTYDGQAHLSPLQRLSPSALGLLAEETGMALFPIEAGLAEASALIDVQYAADADYLYRAEALAAYPGRARRERRSQRDQFRAGFAPRDEPFHSGHVSAARAVLDAWLEDVGQSWAETDYIACCEAFELWEPLGLFGQVTFSSTGEAVGFLLASPLGDGSAAIHFAKGRRTHPGVFAHMFSSFAERHAARFPILNFEQDLGKPGFRQAKRSHGPFALLAKHRLTAARSDHPGVSKFGDDIGGVA